MTDFVLVNISVSSLDNSIDIIKETPPLGILYLASSLEQNGYTVKILDLNIYKQPIIEIIKEIINLNPIIVGFSLYTNGYVYQKLIINKLKKECSDIIIIAGGPHITTYPKAFRVIKGLDVGVLSEGESTIVELADYYIRKKGKLSNINGIVYLKKEEMIITKERDLNLNLDKLPFPSRHLVNLREYKWPGGLISSRGCPGKCIFCQAPYLSRGKYRLRSIDNVMEEIEVLISKYNVKYINFWDDTLTVNKKRLYKLLDAIKNFKINWYCESRVDVLDYKTLKKMKDSGCNQVQIGVETINPYELKMIKKGTTVEEIENVLKWSKTLAIQVNMSLIIGLPKQTRRSIINIINWSKNKMEEGNNNVAFSFLVPYPETEIYRNAKEMGFELIDEYWENEPIEKKEYQDFIPHAWDYNGNISYREALALYTYGNYVLEMEEKEKYGK